LKFWKKPHRGRQHHKVAKRHAGGEQDRNREHQRRSGPLLGRAERREHEAVKLVQYDRQRQHEREDQRDAHRGRKRLADPQGHRLLALRRGRKASENLLKLWPDAV
jgi:hypothetical protein